MTREEFLAQIQSLAGIEVPTAEQQTIIESLVGVFDGSAPSERVTQLEQELAAEKESHEALRKRFKENFWSGGSSKPSKTQPEQPTGFDITIADIFK